MTNNKNIATPDGYRKDAKGRLVPESVIKPIDLERDALATGIGKKAKALAAAVAEFRTSIFDDVQAFVELSAEQYGVRIGGDKGNVTITSYCGSFKVIRAIQDRLVFDERLQAAKALIDSCLQRWRTGAQPEYETIVNDAFRVDEDGNINTARVLYLRRFNFQDEEWVRAMNAISDSLQIASSKSYVRVYERDAKGEYKAISIDLAGA